MADTVILGTDPLVIDIRDAIHVAVISASAGELLRPGEKVRWEDGVAYRSDTHRAVGIVDPYREGLLDTGDTFWLCLFPQTITGMRHHWEHPKFNNAPTADDEVRARARAWLMEYAYNLNSYAESPEVALDMLIEDIKDGWICARGTDMYSFSDLPEPMELAKNLAIMGITVNLENLTYSCTC